MSFIETQRFVDSRRYEGIPKILIRSVNYDRNS